MEGPWVGGRWSVFRAFWLKYRWLIGPLQLRKMRSQTTYVPFLRPAPPYIIDVRRTRLVDMYTKVTHAMTRILLAAASKSVSRQRFNIVMHQVRPHVD